MHLARKRSATIIKDTAANTHDNTARLTPRESILARVHKAQYPSLVIMKLSSAIGLVDAKIKNHICAIRP